MAIGAENLSWTPAALLARFGPIPLERIVWNPALFQATEEDAIRLAERKERLCELVDGVLVEKAVGNIESMLTMRLAARLMAFVDRHDLGLVLGPDGMIRLFAGRLRLPDLSFIAWSQLPGRRLPSEPAWELAPALVVEVLSPSNTPKEMDDKLADYFGAGVRLAWYVEPRTQEVAVYTAVDDCRVLGAADTLDGGQVLPGFALPLAQLFVKQA